MEDSTYRNMALAGGIGSIGSGLMGLFGGGKDPYKSAQGYYDQIPGRLHEGYDPYINAGRSAMGDLQTQYGRLINDPNALYAQLGKGYQQSPGYQWQLNQGMNAAGNAAAAGGLAGSPQHQQQAATLANNLANQDFQNYMNQVTGFYNRGLGGLEGINQMGYGASTGLADSLANYLAMQGQSAFAGQAAQNQARGNAWGDLFGGAGALAAFF